MNKTSEVTTITAIANLLDIGRSLHGGEFSSEINCMSLPLDDAQMEKLERNLDDTAGTVLNAVSAIGALLAYADIDELGKQRINEIGFAINGLSELSERLRDAHLGVYYEIEQRGKVRRRGKSP